METFRLIPEHLHDTLEPKRLTLDSEAIEAYPGAL